MTASQPRILATAAWTDIVAANGSLDSVEVLVQNLAHAELDVVFGGASAPTTAAGVRLKRGEAYKATAANIWVRGDGYMSATVA